MPKGREIGFWSIVVVIFACHLWTIKAPAANNDEAIVVSHALNGRVAFLDLFRPKNLPYEYSFHALTPAYSWILRHWVRIAGLSVTVVRLPACLCGFLNFVLLLWLCRRLRLTRLSSVALLLFTWTPYFLYTAHQVRPLNFVLLAMILNVIWLLFGQGRFLSLLVGATASAALAFHPCGIFALLSMPVAMIWKERQRILSSPRCAWWLIGAMAMGLWVLHTLDIEGAMIFSGMHIWLLGNQIVQIPPLLEFIWNPVALFFKMVWLISRPPHFDFESYPLHYLAFGSLVCGMGYLWRRWRSLKPPLQLLLVFTTAVMISYGATTGAKDWDFHLLFLPWLLIVGLSAFSMMGQDKRPLDPVDAMLFAGIFFLLAQCSEGVIGILISNVFLLRVLIGSRTAMLHTRLRQFFVVLLLLMLNWSIFELVPLIRYLAHFQPLGMGLLLVAPWLFIRFTPKGVVSVWQRPLSARFFYFLFLSILLVDWAFKIKTSYHLFRAYHADPFFQADFLKLYRTQRFVVGPTPLYLLEPQVPLQNPEVLISLRQKGIPVNLAKTFWAAHPSMILLRSYAVDLLETDAARADFEVHRRHAYYFPRITDYLYEDVELVRRHKP